MEPLWSPVVATGGNPSQIGSGRRPQKQAETVAVGCHRLPFGAHGKGRVDATSLLLKRGSLSLLRKEPSPASSKAAGLDEATLTGDAACRQLSRTPRRTAVLSRRGSWIAWGDGRAEKRQALRGSAIRARCARRSFRVLLLNGS